MTGRDPRAASGPVPATAANATIVRAIREKRRLAFTYHDRPRIVEPQCHGIGTRGTALLRAHVVRDILREVATSHRVLPAALFDVAKMAGLVLLDETFDEPGPGYRRNDSAMATIFAQL